MVKEKTIRPKGTPSFAGPAGKLSEAYLEIEDFRLELSQRDGSRARAISETPFLVRVNLHHVCFVKYYQTARKTRHTYDRQLIEELNPEIARPSGTGCGCVYTNDDEWTSYSCRLSAV